MVTNINNKFINSFINASTADSINVRSDGNTFINTTVNYPAMSAILITSADSNNFTNFSTYYISYGGVGGGIEIVEGNSNTFTNFYINDSEDYGIWATSAGSGELDTFSHNIFKNFIITNIANPAISFNDGGGTSNLNNTFLNTTYDDEFVDVKSELTRKWYYQAYVNDTSGNALTSIPITHYNTTGILSHTFTTNASGYTPKSALTEYVNSGGTRSDITIILRTLLQEFHTVA